MHYNDIPLYPYHLDPLRIMVPRNSRTAGAQACSTVPVVTEEASGGAVPPASAPGADCPTGAEQPSTGNSPVPDPPQPVPAEAGREGAAAPAADGADPPPDATPGAANEPPRCGEQEDAATAERHRLMLAWMNEHFDTIEAMARAGEAPERPLPPPQPETEHGAPPPPPVHVRKGDRWNKPKMAEFLRQLAATHSVSAAAKAVGMHRRSAYKLRTRLKGQPFDIAWEAAFRHGYDDLAHAALELALEGEEVPHFYHGELKATFRKRNPQLMVQLLRMRNRAGAPMLGRYGAAAEYWSEHWEQMVQRVETGSVRWDDEREALGEAELAKLDLPDEKQQVDRIIERNLPDEPKGKFGK